jgi:hypothetical protein
MLMAITELKHGDKAIKEAVSLVSNLARYLGKKNTKRLVFTWEYQGLFVVVNDDLKYTIAMYQYVVVLSNLLPDDPIFIYGYWLDMVHTLHEQIRQARAAREQIMIGPLVEV